MPNNRYNDEFKSHAVRLIASGKPVNEVARITGVTVDTLNRWKLAAQEYAKAVETLVVRDDSTISVADMVLLRDDVLVQSKTIRNQLYGLITKELNENIVSSKTVSALAGAFVKVAGLEYMFAGLALLDLNKSVKVLEYSGYSAIQTVLVDTD